MKSLLFKTIIILTLLTTAYYIFLIIPQQKQAAELISTQAQLTPVYNALLQNHLRFEEISRLNPDDPEFEQEQNKLLGKLESTRQNIKDSITPTTDPTLSSLFSDTIDLIQIQSKIIEVYQPNSNSVFDFETKQRTLLERYHTYQQELKTKLEKLTQ